MKPACSCVVVCNRLRLYLLSNSKSILLSPFFDLGIMIAKVHIAVCIKMNRVQSLSILGRKYKKASFVSVVHAVLPVVSGGSRVSK